MTVPQFQTLHVELHDRLGRLQLNDPDHLNPIGSVALSELADAARWFDDQGASIVVVSGAGRAFSAGFDLRELRSPGEGARHTPALGAAMADAISGMAAVTIASIQGPCVGGGFVLALCCDLRVASDDAWFSLPEAELGIPLAWGGVPRLVREIGPAPTIDLVLTCRRVAVAEALAMGFLNQVVPASEREEVVEGLVAILLARDPHVVADTKRQVQAAADALVPTDGDWAGTDLLVEALRRQTGG